ncbi:hypothetical protein R1sor_024341 [Riccia sorocarpa]|uniref:Uncharacterized protein n=1 Tax=Riccia sorocarpa TaxID=122646 RepID=A0ABD3GTH3_9MARC
MTRLPRPKYPSDCKNYHEVWRPGYAHTIRLPEELLKTYAALKRALGVNKSHVDVVRFLFEAADPTISAVLQRESDRAMDESVPAANDGQFVDPGEADPDDDLDENSEIDVAEEAGLNTDHGNMDDVLCHNLQVPVKVDQPQHYYPKATYAMWSKMKRVSVKSLVYMCLVEPISMTSKAGREAARLD